MMQWSRPSVAIFMPNRGALNNDNRLQVTRGLTPHFVYDKIKTTKYEDNGAVPTGAAWGKPVQIRHGPAAVRGRFF